MDVLTLLEVYIKDKLDEMYPDKDSLIDQIAKSLLLNIMLQEYKNNKAFEGYKDIEKLFNDLYEIAEKKATRKENDGSTVYIDPSKKEIEKNIIEEKIKVKQPNLFMMTNSRLDKKILSGEAYDDGEPFWTAVDENGNIIEDKSVKFRVSFDEEFINKHIINKRKLKQYDIELFCAVASIMYDGHDVMSEQSIYKTLTGNKNAKLPPATREKLLESLRMLRASVIKIECNGFSYEGTLLPWERYTAKDYNGQKNISVIAILDSKGFKDKLPFIEYAIRENKLIKYSPELMDIKKLDKNGNISSKRLTKSEQVEEIRMYLKTRIFQIRGNKRNPKKKKGWNVILFSSLKKVVDIDQKKEGRARGYIRTILDYWKTFPTNDPGGHFILDYEEKKENNDYKYIIYLS